MTASMSPLAAARTTLSGNSPTISATGDVSRGVEATLRVAAWAPSARPSVEIPRPGPITFTSVMPMVTAMAETTTV